MKRFSSPYLNLRSNIGEHCEGVSMTEPDQSLTVQEILRRFTAGTLDEDSISLKGDYENDDIDHPTRRYLDLTDIDDENRSLQAVRNEIDRQQKENKQNMDVADSL